MNRKSLAIATPVGSSKGAFARGVLTALEEAGIVADAYPAASSSVIPASWAAIGQASKLGVDFTKATPEGLVSIYLQGRDKGLEFVSNWK